MPMPSKIPLQITGPTYQHPSLPTNAQKCINMYPTYPSSNLVPESNNKPIEEGRGNSTLMLTMGCEAIGKITSELPAINPTGRGLYQIQTDPVTYRQFAAVGCTVFELNFDYTNQLIFPEPLGTMVSGHQPVCFAHNYHQLMVIGYDIESGAVGGNIFDYLTNTWSTITHEDFIGGSHVVMIDSYFIYNEYNSNRFYVSSPNDGLTWDALNVASAESKPGIIVGLGQAKGELWVFCTNSVEVWYNAANSPGMPFSKRVGSDIDIGCSAGYSITSVNDSLIWLDSRRFVVMSEYSAFLRNQDSGYGLAKMSNEAIDAEIASYSRVDDAIGDTYVDNGHVMYEITFPTEKKTWVLDVTTGMWHQKISLKLNNTPQSITNYYAQNQQFLLGISGVETGTHVYLVGRNYQQDDGANIPRTRVTSHLSSNFSLVTIDQLEIKCNTGKAPLGTDPQITLRYSNDSGYTWSNSLMRSLGKTGEYGKRIQWNRLGTAHEWLFEFTVTDEADFTIIDACLYGSVEDL